MRRSSSPFADYDWLIIPGLAQACYLDRPAWSGFAEEIFENFATDWLSGFKQAAESNGHLNPGQTGSHSALTQYGQAGAYELEFAKGRYIVSAYCSPAFLDAGSEVAACEGATRRMAETWYAAMP